VIGEEAPVRLLSAIAERGTAAIDATALTYAGLEAATAVGLLEPARGQDATYRFPHGLARQAVLDLLTDYQRACDNARVAEVLEAEFPAADRRVQRLGYHCASAQALLEELIIRGTVTRHAAQRSRIDPDGPTACADYCAPTTRRPSGNRPSCSPGNARPGPR